MIEDVADKKGDADFVSSKAIEAQAKSIVEPIYGSD